MRESTRSVVLKVLIPLGTKFLLSGDFHLESVFGRLKVSTKLYRKGSKNGYRKESRIESKSGSKTGPEKVQKCQVLKHKQFKIQKCPKSVIPKVVKTSKNVQKQSKNSQEIQKGEKMVKNSPERSKLSQKMVFQRSKAPKMDPIVL